MKFSVIIPIYQNEQYLEKAILSINKAKNRVDIEIIVVDDCSPQKSLLKIKKITNKYKNVNLFIQKKNEGPGIARNRGIKESSGNYLFFLDSDDTLHEDIFINVEKSLNNSSDTDILFFDWIYQGKGTPPINNYEGRSDLDILTSNNSQLIIKEYLLNRVDCSIIYSVPKREFLIKNNITFREGLHEDVDFMFNVILKMQKILTINKPLYLKRNLQNSIVNTFSNKHILGYFKSLYIIYDCLKQNSLWKKHKNSFIKGLINIVSSRLMRINSLADNKKEAISFLYQTTLKLLHHLSIDYKEALPKTGFQTKYEMIFAFFMNNQQKNNEEKVIDYLTEIKNKLWSCFDLHNSVFLAPDEIRTCCKRFFYKNKLKGDVVLLKDNKNNANEFNYTNILKAKTSLLKEINRDNSEECRGCPFLKFDNWQGKPLENGIKYISFEYHSICNMRCSYCDDTYYGGKKASYNVESLVNEFKNNNAVNDVPYIVWGGGEPTLDKSFSQTLKILDKENLDKNKQRIITNSVKYMPEIFDLLNNDKAYIVTSIDAGRKETFKKVRGISQINTVMQNLKKYSQFNPHNVIIKYIVLEENCSDKEITKFVELIKNHNLLKCNFQISCDFKSSKVTQKILLQICYLYCLLLEHNAELIFLDDLVWQRLTTLKQIDIELIIKKLNSHNLSNHLMKLGEYKEIIIWGTGAQAQLITTKTSLLKETKISYFIDPREKTREKTFLNKTIYPPQKLKENSLPVLIAAVQSTPLIYKNYLDYNFNKELIIKKLTL